MARFYVDPKGQCEDRHASVDSAASAASHQSRALPALAEARDFKNLSQALAMLAASFATLVVPLYAFDSETYLHDIVFSRVGLLGFGFFVIGLILLVSYFKNSK